MISKLQQVRTTVKELNQTPSGQLSSGFVVLAPSQLTAYHGGDTGVNRWCQVTNAQGNNCVAGCGSASSSIGS